MHQRKSHPTCKTRVFRTCIPIGQMHVRHLRIQASSIAIQVLTICRHQPCTESLIRDSTAPTEQRAIAHILGTLDDKIELNRRMNETLEAMARALFKSWFVDFDPVRAKAEGRDPGLPKPLADLFPRFLRGLGAGRDSEGVAMWSASCNRRRLINSGVRSKSGAVSAMSTWMA